MPKKSHAENITTVKSRRPRKGDGSITQIARQAAKERMLARQKREEMAEQGLNVDGTPLTNAQVFGRRVRKFRMEKFPNQAQQLTAFRWGLTPQLLNAIENGQRLPRLETAKKIADCLGVWLDTLTEGLSERSEDEE